jgi:hypothetical protein
MRATLARVPARSTKFKQLPPGGELIVEGAVAAIATHRRHTLRVCRETAITGTTHVATVHRAPREVLGVRGSANQSNADENSKHQDESFHD